MELKQILDILNAVETIGIWSALAFALGFKRGQAARPASIRLRSQAQVPDPASNEPISIYLPSNVLDYCEGESEQFAIDDCKTRARRKYIEDNPNWEVVLTSLMREDGEIK